MGPLLKVDLGPKQIDRSGQWNAGAALIFREHIGERRFHRTSLVQHILDKTGYLL
jgi:hypothetical protein